MLNKYFKKNGSTYLTFILALIIIFIIYYLQKVTPLGKNSLLTIDFYHQYGPMLGELFDRIKTNSTLIYSFSMGMGLPFIRNFLNYLSSPFNLIIFLFNRDNLLLSYSIVIALKVALAATSMSYFLNKKFNVQNIIFVPISLLYAFCAYFTAYYWNIMWLDGMVFLPIIILGIEKLVDKNKYLLYIFSLALMLFANYFIGYMICIFSFVYFLGYLLISKLSNIKQFINKILLFIASSLLSAGLVAVLLIPLFLSLKSISATSDLWPSSQYYFFSFWEFLANHFTGVGSTVFSSGISNAANISVGILSIPLIMLFIINPKINYKIKLFYLILVLFFVLSFFYAPLDFIWHGFHVPNDLPYRYSFLYSFVLILMSAYSIYNIKFIKTRFAIIIYLLTTSFISLLYFFKYSNIDTGMILLNFVVLTLSFIIFLIIRYFYEIKKYALLLFIILVMVEIIIVVNHNWNIHQYVDDFYSDYYPTQTAIKYIHDNDDSLMFRMERMEMMTFNDPSWYSYYGQTTFSSMAYENLAILQAKLGMPGNNINSFYYKQNTPLYDLMFNIKYFVGSSWDIKRYTLHYNKNDILVFKNNYNPGLMFAVNKDIEFWNPVTDNPFYNQNDFIKKGFLIDDVLAELKPDEEKTLLKDSKKIIKYTYKNIDDNMYFYTNNSCIDFIIVNDTVYYFTENIDYYKYADEEIKIFDYVSLKENHLINTRTDEEEYNIFVGYNNYQENAFYAYKIDDNKFIEAASLIEQNQVLLSEFNEDNITGFIHVDQDKTVYTSIPYDDGWKVIINGKKVETSNLGNALLSFNVSQGDNHIKLSYQSKGLKTGAIITFFSIIICVALSSKKIKKS